LTATVTALAPGGGTPTGTVTFKSGLTVLSTVALTAGKASLFVPSLTVGSHSITADYNGSADYDTSNSAVLTQTVKQAATSTTITSSLNPSTFGQTVTFKATVAPVAPGAGTPTGSVTFKNGTTTLATETLVAGKATFATSTLARGSHFITAEYLGSVDDSASTSAVLTQKVN
jgi:hypothetical protein